MKRRSQRALSSSDSDSPPSNKKKTVAVNGDVVGRGLEEEGSSSDSSLGEHLQAADELDLDSEFFVIKPVVAEQVVGTLESSSSSDSDDEPLAKKRAKDKSVRKDTIATIKQDSVKASTSEEVSVVEEAAKEDILQLLAKGEGKSTDAKETQQKKKKGARSDSDWEEVESDAGDERALDKITDVQITVKVGDGARMKKKGVDMVQAIKRRINRIRKENQVFVHKVHFLAWLAHGNYVNDVLNSADLLAVALSLLPSEKCYPPDRTDFSYLEAVVKWYGQTVKEKKTKDVEECDLKEQLAKQIAGKYAADYKTYVYGFICVLRSLGIKCRLVLNLVVAPLKPAKEDLCSLSSDKKTEDNNGKSKPAKEDKSKVDAKKKADVKSKNIVKKDVAAKSNTKVGIAATSTKKGDSKSAKRKEAEKIVEKTSKNRSEAASKHNTSSKSSRSSQRSSTSVSGSKRSDDKVKKELEIAKKDSAQKKSKIEIVQSFAKSPSGKAKREEPSSKPTSSSTTTSCRVRLQRLKPATKTEGTKDGNKTVNESSPKVHLQRLRLKTDNNANKKCKTSALALK